MKQSTPNFYFSSTVCSEKEYDSVITEDKYKTAQAAIKFYRLFCDGFSRNGYSIHVYSKRPTTKLKSGKTFIPAKNEIDGKIDYHYSRIINIPVLSIIYSLVASFFWYLNPFRCKRNSYVFIDPLNVSIGLGTYYACKIRGIKTIMIITDLPRYYCYNPDGKMSFQQKISERLSKKADAYVLVTEQMNEVINESNKPSIVIEGFADLGLSDVSIDIDDKYDKFVCMYTGGLDIAYGLDYLIKGFLKADIPDSELHIYGAGSYSEEIERIAEKNKKVLYLGTKDNSIIVNEQMKATLLINPRYSDSVFTRYSFPSKNMEYAASGTPMLTTNLPGMPFEYHDHVFLLEDETPTGMANKLKDISSFSKQELYSFGVSTKNWVLNNKNCKAQVLKIISFIEQSL